MFADADNGRFHEDPCITVTCSNHDKVHEPVIVLASDGIAVEEGNLGQYSLSGEHNKSPYYVQSNTLSNSASLYLSPVYLYRADDNQWHVGPYLGNKGGWLKNTSDSVSVPETGWQVFTDGENGKVWLDDPQLRVICEPLAECGDITVSDDTFKKMFQASSSKFKNSNFNFQLCLGVYKRTGIISSGRFVFKHEAQDKYLSIAPGATSWVIGDTPGASKGYILSASGANCPASKRNRNNARLNKKSWIYSDKEVPSITVTCSNHSPDYY